MTTPLSVTYSGDETQHAAIDYAKQHNLPCAPYNTNNTKDENNSILSLNFKPEFIELRDNEKNIAIHIDFISGDLAHRQKYGGGRGQSIAKAIGLKQGTPPPTVLDATAGLAKDAYVLACLGCSMTLLERSPIILALINDAIQRAEEDEHFQTILQNGFKVINQSSIEYLAELSNKQSSKVKHPEVICPDVTCPDVIYLDPMYPDKKKSASVKKNMQILQKLLGKDEDTQELLNAALKVAKKRVVVKRPKGAENLTALKPTYNVESKKTRYDVYIIPQA